MSEALIITPGKFIQKLRPAFRYKSAVPIEQTARRFELDCSKPERRPAPASSDCDWSGQAAALEDETRSKLQLTRAAEPRG